MWLAALLMAAIPAREAGAQIISGDLVVRVVDPADLIVPGAALTLTEVETGIAQAAPTDAQGTSLFGQLKPGLYRLEASAPGFRTKELKIQRSTFGAEFGRSAAVLNTTIKSGTNTLHRSVFEFNRDERFDATDFFLNRTGRSKQPFQQNNFGTAVGGPLVVPGVYNGRSRTFWFFNYEGFRQNVTSSATGLHPSAAQLKGTWPMTAPATSRGSAGSGRSRRPSGRSTRTSSSPTT